MSSVSSAKTVAARRNRRRSIHEYKVDVNEAVQLSDRILMMNKGGTLYADIPINLPRPRLLTDRNVVTQQADVLALFEQMRAEPVDAESEGVDH